MDKFYTRKDENNKVKLEITIPADAFAASYKTLLKTEAEKVEIKGFRKGAAPMEMLEVQLKPAILAETFERIAPYYVAQALGAEKLEPVAPPEYSELSSLDLNQPVKFTVTITLMPEFKMADLKKVKVNNEKVEVKDEELQKTLDQMKKSQKTKETEINDAWAKEIAKMNMLEGVENLADLKKQLSRLLLSQKEVIVRRQNEQDALKQAIDLSKIEIPSEAIHYEAHEREHSFMHELEDAKTSFEDFAKAQGMTVEAIRDLWHKDAEEALKNDTFLRLYAESRNVTISDQELKDSIEAIKNGEGKNADPKIFENEQWLEYIKSYLLKQKSYSEFIKEVLGEFKSSVVADDDKTKSAKSEAKADSKKD